MSGPSSGTLTLQPNGAFGFAPAAGFAGTVTFTYEAGDGTLRSIAATVTITVNAVNDPPVAHADSYTTAEDTALTSRLPQACSATTPTPTAARR